MTTSRRDEIERQLAALDERLAAARAVIDRGRGASDSELNAAAQAILAVLRERAPLLAELRRIERGRG